MDTKCANWDRGCENGEPHIGSQRVVEGGLWIFSVERDRKSKNPKELTKGKTLPNICSKEKGQSQEIGNISVVEKRDSF